MERPFAELLLIQDRPHCSRCMCVPRVGQRCFWLPPACPVTPFRGTLMEPLWLALLCCAQGMAHPPPCHRLEPGLKTLSGLLQGSPDCFTLYSALLFFFYFSQQLVFNSVTNCLGPRKFLHSGKLYKAKSNKELYGFLFNDFLLLTQIIKPLGSSGTDKVFSPKSNLQYKMYKTVSAALVQGWGQGSGAPFWGSGQEPS